MNFTNLCGSEAEAAGACIHDDETSELAMALLAISRIEEQDKLEEKQRLELIDADLALAMKLQEEVNADFDAISGDTPKLDSKTAWSAFTTTRSSLRSSISNEFPPLPAVNSAASKKPQEFIFDEEERASPIYRANEASDYVPSAPPLPSAPPVRNGNVGQYLECPICCEVENPAASGPCGHVFCAVCWKSASYKCPVCRAHFNSSQIIQLFL